MKKQELAVVNGSEVEVKNSNKKDQPIMTLLEATEFIQKAVVGSKCKVFTDSKFYVGFGVKCNGMSVNVKKSKYNIYCNDTVADVLETLKGVDVRRKANAADHTRPHCVECKSTAQLKEMIGAVLKQVYIPATDTN